MRRLDVRWRTLQRRARLLSRRLVRLYLLTVP